MVEKSCAYEKIAVGFARSKRGLFFTEKRVGKIVAQPAASANPIRNRSEHRTSREGDRSLFRSTAEKRFALSFAGCSCIKQRAVARVQSREGSALAASKLTRGDAKRRHKTPLSMRAGHRAPFHRDLITTVSARCFIGRFISPRSASLYDSPGSGLLRVPTFATHGY